MSLADRVATDPIDADRVAFRHSVQTLCKRLENSRYAVDLAGDPCWLVRSVLASNVGKICDNLPDDVLPKNIQTVTLNLLQDEEVRRRWEERLRTPDPSKCTMSGLGLKMGEVLVMQMFTIQAKNAKGYDITEGGAPSRSTSR